MSTLLLGTGEGARLHGPSGILPRGEARVAFLFGAVAEIAMRFRNVLLVVSTLVVCVAAGALLGWATERALGPSRGELAVAARTVLSPEMTVTLDRGYSNTTLAMPDLPPWFGHWSHKVEATLADGDHRQVWDEVSVRLRESGFFPTSRASAGPTLTANYFFQGDVRMYVSTEGSSPVQLTAAARPSATAQQIRTATWVGASWGAVLGVVLAVLLVARHRRWSHSAS